MNDKHKEEELIICPYDNSHHIRRTRMNTHLDKCRKNYEAKLIRCDFNASHMVPETELRYHHQSCPDRRKIETQIVDSRPVTENKFPIAVIQNHELEDNWDTVSVPSYDPNKYLENNEVLRHIDVESEAKRRNFRLQERQRLATTSKKEVNSVPVARAMETEKVALPAHRPVTNVTDDKYRPSLLAQKFKLNTKKVFVQNPTRQEPPCA